MFIHTENKKKLVEEFNCLTKSFFAEINSLKSDALIPVAPTTIALLKNSELIMNHLLVQVSFLREEIKSKDQQINSLSEHEPSRDDTCLSKKVLCYQQKRFFVTSKFKTNKYRTEIKPGTNSIHTTNANTKTDSQQQ